MTDDKRDRLMWFFVYTSLTAYFLLVLIAVIAAGLALWRLAT